MELVVYHVGGGDEEIGPARAILDHFGAIVRLVLFDARPGSTEIAYQSFTTKSGIKTDLVTIGIDDSRGEKPFFVTDYPLSSSLLPCSPLTRNEDPEYSWCRTWGENTRVKEQITVPTTTIDAIASNGAVPSPDFLSVDAQGAEVRILRGSATALSQSILGLVIECEFFEIYDQQGLIEDELALLAKYGFRLVDIVSQQRWFPGPPVGEGFLTVGEAIFLKFVQFGGAVPHRGYETVDSLTAESAFKLALISYAFGRQSYSYLLLKRLRERHPKFVVEREREPVFDRFFQALREIDLDYPKYLADPAYFRRANAPKVPTFTDDFGRLARAITRRVLR